jgi:hypothetical protein
MLVGIIFDQQSTCTSEEKLEKPGFRNFIHFGPAYVFEVGGVKTSALDFICRDAFSGESGRQLNLHDCCAGRILGNFAGVQEG